MQASCSEPLTNRDIEAVDDGDNNSMHGSVFSLQRLLRARSFLNDQYGVPNSGIDSVNRQNIFADVLAIEIDRLNNQHLVLSQRLILLGRDDCSGYGAECQATFLLNDYSLISFLNFSTSAAASPCVFASAMMRIIGSVFDFRR